MSKVQWWVLGSMLLTALIVAGAQGASLSQASTAGANGPKQIAQALPPNFLLYWVGGLIALILLADLVPTFAGWVAGLILVGAVLTQGPKALQIFNFSGTAK